MFEGKFNRFEVEILIKLLVYGKTKLDRANADKLRVLVNRLKEAK